MYTTGMNLLDTLTTLTLPLGSSSAQHAVAGLPLGSHHKVQHKDPTH